MTVENVEEVDRLRAPVRQAQFEETRQNLSLLADAGDLLASSLDYEATLTTLAQVVVPRLADWCAVHLVDEDGAVRQITVTHPDPAKVQLARELEFRYPYDPDARSGVPQVLRSGQPELLSEIPDELLEAASPNSELLQVLRELGLKSSMVVPLAARGHPLGAITFVAAESGRRYGPGDVTLAQELARCAALAVDNARLYQTSQRVAAERSAILSQMTDGVILCNTLGTVTFMNEAAERLYGGDLVGKSLSDYGTSERGETLSLLDPQNHPYQGDALPMQRALSEGQVTIDSEARLRHADGTEVIVLRSATPVTANDGTKFGAVLTVRDVTVQRTSEQQKDDFLAAAAHDLKTPLTSLKGLAQILQRRLARDTEVDAERLMEGLVRIEESATRMTSLINELLDLSCLQAGEGLQLNRRATDLIALVTRCVAEHQEVAGAQPVTLSSPGGQLMGNWDADRLERVITNLLSNASKYSRDNSPTCVTITKQVESEVEWAFLSVQDQGIGIPVDDIPHIFERFHRGRNVGRETLGTGIGLAGAKQIVVEHGGMIELVTQEGVGSTFTVRLPLTPVGISICSRKDDNGT